MLSEAHRAFLQTIGNPKRVALMLLLLRKPLTVTELVKRSHMEQSTVSHHLRRLRLCTFVRVQARGKRRIYTVNEETAGPLFRLMERHVQKYCRKFCSCRPPSPTPHG